MASPFNRTLIISVHGLTYGTEKCTVMHIGHSWANEYYMTEGSLSKKLESVQEERDLGIIVSSNIKSFQQCSNSATSNRLVMVRRNFKRLDVNDFNLMYVRPHLDYCTHAWSQYLAENFELLENAKSGYRFCSTASETQLCRQIEGFGSYIFERA